MTVVNGATTLLIYLLVVHLFGRTAGVVAAASYAVLSASPSVLGLAGHAAHFALLPAMAGLLLLLKTSESNRISKVFCCGVLLGLPFLMKQPGIFFAAFGGMFLLYQESGRRPRQLRGIIAHSAAFSLGATIPFGLTCLVMAAAGIFGKFWFWTFSYARKYASILSIGQGVSNFLGIFPTLVGSAILVWILAGVGLTAIRWDSAARVHAVFVIGFVLSSVAAVCPGFYFRPHYFIFLLPAAALLAGVAVDSAARKLLQTGRSRVFALIPMTLFVIVFADTAFQERKLFFFTDPLIACREIYGNNPFPEALEISKYIRAHTSPRDRIAVLGSEPEFTSTLAVVRPPATSTTYGMMEHQKYSVKMQEEMISEIEVKHPEYIVDVQVPTSWLRDTGSPTLIFEWA